MIADWLSETGQSKNAFNARAWGEQALWGIAVGEVDPRMDIFAYQCAREAGRFGNRALDEIANSAAV